MKNFVIEKGMTVHLKVFLNISGPIATITTKKEYDYENNKEYYGYDDRIIRFQEYHLKIGDIEEWDRPKECYSLMDFDWKHKSVFDTSKLIGAYKKIGMKKSYYVNDRFGGRGCTRDLVIQNLKDPSVRLYDVWTLISPEGKELL